MITTCTECQARYQLDDEKIPRRKIRVRCPACSGVFALDGTLAKTAVVEPMAPAAPPTPEPISEPMAAQDDLIVSNGFEDPVARPDPPKPAVSAPAATVASAAAKEDLSAPVAVLERAEASPTTSRRRRSKEEMLARALVSDILVYNRELRDTALAEGNLLEALGAEIKKSWELYKEKVTPEVANSTNHFRDALNEILAEGDKVF
jgi:predicted Zn finger-like uncharacterized protein|nr:zinc-ribbon domain-containing protein [Candidatus Krumholzibacteria bacterium]